MDHPSGAVAGLRNPVTNYQITAQFDFCHELDFQQILTNPILDIAAHVSEEERYKTFKICYRTMRILDDLVDDRKSIAYAAPQLDVYDALSVVVEADDLGDGLILALIVTHDKLEFDVHKGASPGSSVR